MKDTEPQIYYDWSIYIRLRQNMLSAILFNNIGWHDWEIGHAKLIGILLWYFENNKQTRFKYNKVFKKHCYRRAHNYYLLKGIIKAGILRAEGHGYYTFFEEDVHKLKKFIWLMKQVDKLGLLGKGGTDGQALHDTG